MRPRQLAVRVCAALRTAGHQAYFVGGCVRDLQLGRAPADYDIATDARPERVQQLFPSSISVGAKFGVIKVFDGTQGAEQSPTTVEVATFRSDVGYSDGRHPDRVEFSRTPREDVSRRDFTINGLMLDPESGTVLDFVGGLDDLRAHIVRAIGQPDLRFREDKLRMARAVRFAARFNYDIEPATFAAIQAAAPQIHQVSPERLREELTKLLTEGAARRAFELLEETGLLAELLPEVSKMRGVPQPPEYHPEGDVWIHTRMMLEMLRADAPSTLAWAVLLHDVGKPPTFRSAEQTGDRIRFNEHAEIGARMAAEICRRLRFSTDDSSQIEALVANHLRFKDVFDMRPSTLKRFIRLPYFDQHLELHRLDCSCSHGKLDAYEFVRNFIRETPPDQVRPPRLVTGDDLSALGLSPGPLFKEILENVEEGQLEGRLSDRDQALDFVRSNYLKIKPLK
jgi:poly(A) polymerase